MDKVRKFDEVLKKKEEQQFMMLKTVQVLFFGLGGIAMFIPFEAEELYLTIFLPWYVLGMALVFSLQQYMQLKDGKNLINVYKFLEYMPVDRRDIYKVRKEHLNRICKKILIAYVICQCITAVLMKEFTAVTIFYPVIMTGCLWISGILYIRKWGNK